MARTYRRDSRGRFSGGGGGGGGRATGGSLAARSSARRSAAKLSGKDTGDKSLSGTASRRAQKAAVTRTGRASKAAQTANRTKMTGGPAGTIKGRKNLAPSKEVAQMGKKVRKYKNLQSDPPSPANNFSTRSGGAREAYAKLNPRYQKQKLIEKSNDYDKRRAMSQDNKNFETQRAVNTGALSGQKTKFRAPAQSAARYARRVENTLSTKTYGQLKSSQGISRRKVGQQFNLLGGSNPIKSAKSTPSNFNADKLRLRGRRRGRISNP